MPVIIAILLLTVQANDTSAACRYPSVVSEVIRLLAPRLTILRVALQTVFYNTHSAHSHRNWWVRRYADGVTCDQTDSSNCSKQRYETYYPVMTVHDLDNQRQIF